MKSVLCLLFFISFSNGFIQNQHHNVNKNKRWETFVSNVNTPSKEKITINLLIHFDSPLTSKLTEQHGFKYRKTIKTISKNIVRDVEKLFSDKSLHYTVVFNLIDTRFLKNNSRVLSLDENGQVYLKNYCEWQALKKRSRRKWYYSVLLTGLDLYYIDDKGRQIRRSTGRGYFGGLCRIEKSCSIVEWHPKNVPYLLAHEIAHSLGMMHDGVPNNRCKRRGLMMAASYNPRRHPRTWSSCSRADLKRFLQSKKAWCLRKNFAENETFD